MYVDYFFFSYARSDSFFMGKVIESSHKTNSKKEELYGCVS